MKSLRAAARGPARLRLDVREDRFLLLPLPGHDGVRILGIAVRPSEPDFYYVG